MILYEVWIYVLGFANETIYINLAVFYVPPGLILKHSTWCVLSVECFVRISEMTASFALYYINCWVFITVVESVYCAVRADSLYKADYFLTSKVNIRCSFSSSLNLIDYNVIESWGGKC